MTCPLRKIAYQLRISKWYFETTFVSGMPGGNAAVGVCPRNEAMGAHVGYNDGQGTIGKFQSSGNVYRDGGTNSGSGAAFNVAGDTVGVAIDATSRIAWFRVNGGVWNGSASNDPATGVGGLAHRRHVPALPRHLFRCCVGLDREFHGTIRSSFADWIHPVVARQLAALTRGLRRRRLVRRPATL
ncbi:SPRY domain-containing protein [Burkholderia cepacia]|uniref:hypothetical protein n=1 Tax=Burkholderia cepacia TaxID=292 RepID=UPI001CF1BB38|nr:hypothetical protein [Burkholderia cepacia]MCA8321663.1 hypothetical protein [Burkholderia cepacia]